MAMLNNQMVIANHFFFWMVIKRLFISLNWEQFMKLGVPKQEFARQTGGDDLIHRLRQKRGICPLRIEHFSSFHRNFTIQIHL
jgi:hypothetical protein